MLDDAKETAQAAAKKTARVAEDVKDRVTEAADRVHDRADELTADAKVKQAEAERASAHARSEAKERMRD